MLNGRAQCVYFLSLSMCAHRVIAYTQQRHTHKHKHENTHTARIRGIAVNLGLRTRRSIRCADECNRNARHVCARVIVNLSIRPYRAMSFYVCLFFVVVATATFWSRMKHAHLRCVRHLLVGVWLRHVHTQYQYTYILYCVGTVFICRR